MNFMLRCGSINQCNLHAANQEIETGWLGILRQVMFLLKKSRLEQFINNNDRIEIISTMKKYKSTTGHDGTLQSF